MVLALGLVVGVAVTAACLRAFPDIRNLSKTRPIDHDRSALARILMGHVAHGFVAVGHPADPMSTYGAVFYDRPFGYGGGLCAMRRYRFASAVVNGPLVMDTAHSDPLDVQHVYGLWRESGPAADGENEDEACARYRDFDHVIEG